MWRTMLALTLLLLLLLPACSSCATCYKIINFFLSDASDPDWREQNTIFQGYADEQKEREEKSKAWSVSALPSSWRSTFPILSSFPR